MRKILAVLLFCLVGFAFAADQTVTVSGSATEKKPSKEAYEDALHSAIMNAVEKNLGTWLKSQSSYASFSESNEFANAKQDILSKADDFVSNYKVLKRGLSSKGFYEVTINATISSDRLSAEIRKYVGALKSKMDNPSIAFVLTSWEKRGVFSTTVVKANVAQKNSYSGNAQTSEYGYDESRQSGSVSARASGSAYDENYVASAERGSGSARVSGSESARVRANVSDGQASYDGDYAASGSYAGERQYEGASRSASKSSRNVDAAYESSNKSGYKSDRGYAAKAESESNASLDASVTTGKIDETMFAKFADMGIIDGFQQEFKEKGFDLKAADKAREIAVAPSAAQTGINVSDRSAVRDLAEKEGANYVARGEVTLLGQNENASGQIEVTAKIGTEIIDVNSGDIVASYSNTVTALNSNVDKAKAQAVKKASVVAAKTLASQTLQTWQERAEKGRQYTIEIRNIKRARSQKMPLEKALKSICSITAQTSPSTGVQTYTVLFKGSKSDLGEALLGAIGDAKGFSEDEFDGPNDENGKIVFKFTK